MAKLTAKERQALPKGDFALGGERYPIEDENHARNALARVAQHGTDAEKKAVRAAVHQKYPHMGVYRTKSPMLEELNAEQRRKK